VLNFGAKLKIKKIGFFQNLKMAPSDFLYEVSSQESCTSCKLKFYFTYYLSRKTPTSRMVRLEKYFATEIKEPSGERA